MSSSTEELPEPPWSSRRAKERRPRREPVTRESITHAALRIVDAEGLDALSMRRLAQELGCQASALYAHLSGKPELLQLLIDHVAGELDVPEPDPAQWQEQIAEVMRQMYAIFAAHNDLAGAALANIPTGHNALLQMDRMLAILRAGGLPKQVAAYAADTLPLFVVSSAYEGSLFRKRLEREPGYFDELDVYFRSLPPERFPTMFELVDELMSPDDSPEARFEFGLGLLIRGLASYAEGD